MLDVLNSLIGRLYLAAKREEGQAMTEYAIVLAVLVVGGVTILFLLTDGIGDKFTSIVTDLKKSPSDPTP